MPSVLDFPYSAQVVFVLFVSSHSIIWRHQFQGYKIEKKKKKKKAIINTESWIFHSFANQTQTYFKVNTVMRSIDLILKIKRCECVYATLHSNLP